MRTRYLTFIGLLLTATACNKMSDNAATPRANADLSVTDNLLAVTETETAQSQAADESNPHVCTAKLTDSKPIIFDEDDSDVSGRGVLVKSTKWNNAKTLKIYFINGGDFLQGKVVTFARRWANYANVHFVVTDNKAESDIRVGFKVGGDTGSWSWLGTDAETYFKGKQTMNFGWFNSKTSDKEFSRTIVHEFGHALGLGHEQLSPVEDIHWDKPKVYAYYMGPPNNWTRAQVDFNIFDRYKKKDVKNTKFDPVSIMQYPVPAEFTTDGSSIGYNYYLSDKDKKFIAQIYPGAATVVAEPWNP